jgi:hypothetical protein
MKHKKIFLLTAIILLNSFFLLTCSSDFYLNKMNNLFELDPIQLEYIKTQDYKKIHIRSMKFKHATEFIPSTTSKIKIGKTTIYIDVCPNYYILFEIIEEANKNSLLEHFLQNNYQKIDIIEKEEFPISLILDYFPEGFDLDNFLRGNPIQLLLFALMEYGNIESLLKVLKNDNDIEIWKKDDKIIYYVNNYYDKSINQLTNWAVIPY